MEAQTIEGAGDVTALRKQVIVPAPMRYRLADEFLANTKNPPYEGEIAYGHGFEHCWNGDPTQPNAISRLRYHEMFLPRIVERIRKSAPPGADLTSWKY